MPAAVDRTVCRQRADVVLVLDQSTSIVTSDYENWFTEMLGFATRVSQLYDIGPDATQIGLLTQSHLSTPNSTCYYLSSSYHHHLICIAHKVSRLLKCARDSRYNQADNCTYGSPRTVTRRYSGHNKAYNTIHTILNI